MRRRLFSVLAAVALVALASCSGGSGATNKVVDASFLRFDGASAKLSDFRGKPLVVNFFSSTCGPCVSEMPALEQVHRQLGDKVVFLGIDIQDTVEGGQAFIKTVGITWELGRDPDASVLQGTFGSTNMPTTVVLDAQGREVYSHLGALLNPDDFAKELRSRGLVT